MDFVNIARRSEFAPQIALPWIVRLRYGMVVAQIITALVVEYLLKIRLPIHWILLVPLLVFASNLWLAKKLSRQDLPWRVQTSTIVAWIFVFDIFCLTALLMLTGGATNPFSVLYLVHITLAATILTKKQTWLLGGLSIVGFGLLFWVYRPLAVLEIHAQGNGPNFHLLGMWISFTAAVLLVALFSAKISELLREREDSLLRMQDELAKRDRLASLVTLAAGAAHELGTPLGTIAVAAKELELCAIKSVESKGIVEDSRLIRSEVDRCREILSRMGVRGAEPAGEALATVSVPDLLDALSREFSQQTKSRIEFPKLVDLCVLHIPRHAVLQALIALVKNALESGEPGVPVQVQTESVAESIRFVVRDRGRGMSAEMLRRIGEPFFTTKPPGKGMGLGIFLARTLAEQLGGRLTFESYEDIGTSAVLEIPIISKSEFVCE